MANTIILKKSSTASAVPSADSLQPGELAVNLADKKLYTKTVGGTVIQLADGNAAGATGTVTSVNVAGGTTGLTFSGGPITTSGTITMNGTLGVANGGTGATTLTANNVLLGNGTSALQTVAPSTTGNVLTSDGTTWTSKAPSTVTLTASGSISAGAPVIQNPDGTVSAISGSFGSDQLGTITQVVNLAANYGPYGAAYDPLLDKFVMLLRDSAGGSALTTGVGTVSGNGISIPGSAVTFGGIGPNNTATIVYDPSVQRFVAFYVNTSNFGCARVLAIAGDVVQPLGAEVVFLSSAIKSLNAVYDPVSRKIIVVYNSSNNTSAIVGTSSSTSITFGTPVVAFAANTLSNDSRSAAITYDTTNSKVVLATTDSAGDITAVVGTVSGTSISFGATATFGTSPLTPCGRISAAFDQNAGKVFFAYRDGTVSAAFGVVGTVSGTSISFGTPVQIRSGTTVTTSSVYDPVQKKIVVIFNQNTNYYSVATISGTSVSFTSPVTVATTGGTDAQSFVASTYSPSNQTPVICFWSSTVSRYTATVVQTATVTNTNLVGNGSIGGSNFVGFSTASYTNGQSAVISISGAVTTNQTGLLAGDAYYVQADGTLGLAPGPFNVYAGRATSATSLIVRG